VAWGRFAAAKWSPCELDYLKTHKDEAQMQLAGWLGKSANAIKNKLYELEHGHPPNKVGRSSKGTKIGKRQDLDGMFFRSGWEADIMRYLKHKGFTDIQYEPETFTYTQFGHKHGTISYVPDFKVLDFIKKGESSWIEVKGFLKSTDKVRLRRFKKYFPEEFKKLVIICGGETSKTYLFCKDLGIKKIICFSSIKKEFKDKIPNWES
jgi:hypothetical protein